MSEPVDVSPRGAYVAVEALGSHEAIRRSVLHMNIEEGFLPAILAAREADGDGLREGAGSRGQRPRLLRD